LFAAGAVAVPVPESETTFGLPVPFDVIVRLPLRAPAIDGLNAIVIVQLVPPATTPHVLPTIGNSDTELDTMLEIEIGDAPGLVTVTGEPPGLHADGLAAEAEARRHVEARSAAAAWSCRFH
jgi:hypothetical protein